MENTLVLENWEIELLNLIKGHIPDTKSSMGTSTNQTVMDDLASADPARFADFAPPFGTKTIHDYVRSIDEEETEEGTVSQIVPGLLFVSDALEQPVVSEDLVFSKRSRARDATDRNAGYAVPRNGPQQIVRQVGADIAKLLTALGDSWETGSTANLSPQMRAPKGWSLRIMGTLT